jgi:protein-tyrosine phosphatase
MTQILMVCLGNICRSPLAEGILKKKLKEKNKTDHYVDSAGTANYHVGQKPDERAIKKAEEHGINIANHRGRQFSIKDFQRFDKIYVMDISNYLDVIEMAETEEDKQKVDYILNVIKPNSNTSVPDPFYGGDSHFEAVYQLLDMACEQLAEQLA